MKPLISNHFATHSHVRIGRLFRRAFRAAALTAALGSLVAICGLANSSEESVGFASPDAGGTRDFTSFKLIAERNIFNGSRAGAARIRSNANPTRVDALILVGAMSYEKGAFAFFDGSTADFRKVLEPGQAIANYTLAEIHPWGVRLRADTNTIELRVGMQLRREEDGDWELVAIATPASAPLASLSTSVIDQSEIVKRLIQQREQELK